MIPYIVDDCKCIYIHEDVNGLLKDKVDDGLLFSSDKTIFTPDTCELWCSAVWISIHSETKQDINVSRLVMWRVWLEKWTYSDSTKTQTVPIGREHLQKFHSIFEDSLAGIMVTATQTSHLPAVS